MIDQEDTEIQARHQQISNSPIAEPPTPPKKHVSRKRVTTSIQRILASEEYEQVSQGMRLINL